MGDWSWLTERIHDACMHERVTERMRQTGSYHDVPMLDLPDGDGWPPPPIEAGLHERRFPAEDEDFTHWLEQGALRARQGVTATDMLHAWRIYHFEFRRRAQELLADSPTRASTLLELFELIAAWTDSAMIATERGHRIQEMESHRAMHANTAELVRRALLGGMAFSELRRGAELFGLDLSLPYRALRARISGTDQIASLENLLHTNGRGGARLGLTAMIDGDLCGFVSATPVQPAEVPIGVSKAVNVEQLPAAFGHAGRALLTAVALGRTGVVEFESLGVAPAILADQAVGAHLEARYITPVEKLGEGGQETLNSLAAYLSNDRQLKTTAEQLHLHPNSLRYRLDRFEEITGCSLRHHDDLMEVWWALRYRALRGGPGDAHHREPAPL
jgi:hypothetical protein